MSKQLIFDCDGVLVDSEIIAAHVMVELLNHHGIPIDVPYYLNYCTGKTFSGLKKSLSDQYGVALPDDFIPQVTEDMEARVTTSLQPIDGINEVLLQLSDIPKAVVSNSDLYQVRDALRITELDHFFDHLFSSEQVQNAKPSPDVYLFAASELAVRPDDCLVVEDSVSGATAAIAAGMNVIGLLAGRHIVDGHVDRLRAVGVSKFAEDSGELQRLIHKSMTH